MLTIVSDLLTMMGSLSTCVHFLEKPPRTGRFLLLYVELFSDAGLNAACFVFLDNIDLCRFVYCFVESRKKLLGISLFAGQYKLFDFFECFFVCIRCGNVPLVAAF